MSGSLDREGEALKELGLRATRLARWVAGVCVSVGIAAGIGAYAVLRQMQLDMIGVHVPYVTGGMSFGVVLAAILIATKQLNRVLVRWRAEAWIAEVSARYGVAVAPLHEFIELWSG